MDKRTFCRLSSLTLVTIWATPSWSTHNYYYYYYYYYYDFNKTSFDKKNKKMHVTQACGIGLIIKEQNLNHKNLKV